MKKNKKFTLPYLKIFVTGMWIAVCLILIQSSINLVNSRSDIAVFTGLLFAFAWPPLTIAVLVNLWRQK
jgi:hypothetical protein